MNLARVDEALLQAHQELIEDPRHGVEGLDAASCPRTSDTWRSWPSGQRGKASPPSGGGPGSSAASDQKPPHFRRRRNPACAAWPFSHGPD
jgi:hypothetical protein